ncbi:MAG: PAS domain-containing protein [Nitrospirota bacterium]
MKTFPFPRRARALIWFLVSLVLFLSAGTLAILSFQRHLAEDDLAAHREREVRLLGDVVEATMNARDWAAAQRYLDIFCRDRQEIALARMIVANGEVLAHFERPVDAAHLLRVSRTVDYGAGKHAVVELAYDLRDPQMVQKRLAATIVLASVLFAVLMGTLLWRILRATAFRPLEQTVEDLELRVAERTSDWMISNKELKEEIAERLAVEQQLRIKDRAIASAINGIALSGFDGRLTYVNEAFLDLWGYAGLEDVLGRNATEFWQSSESAARIIQELMTNGAWVGELTARRADGSLFAVQLSADIVKKRSGAPICMMASFVDVTEQKKAASRLRSSEERLLSITEAVSDVIYRRRPDGTITYVSPSVRDVLGFAPEEVLGMNFRDFAHPDDLGRAVAVDRQLRDGRPVKDHALRVFRKTGETIDVEVTLVPLMNDDGLFEVQGILRDVTERKAMEAALRASEARIRLIMENINEIIYQVSIADEQDPARATVEFVSGQTEGLVGHSAGEFLSDSDLWLNIIHRDDLQVITESTRRLIRERSGVTRVYRVRHGRIGDYRWMEDKMVPQFSESGRLIGYFGVARDVTKRKRMEGEREALIVNLRRLLDAISLSQQEWRETFDSITDPILLVNADRMVRRANRAFGALFGLRPQDVINRDCLDLLYRGQTPPGDDPILRGLREAGPVEGEIADPERSRVYRASIFPFTTSEKDLPGAIVVLKDITDEREREMLLIMSERLASLGRMASGIAHEINNPLAAIAGCVDGMSRRINREQIDPPLFLRYLKIIKDEITRTKNITTNMLSFVRKSSYEQKQIDLHATIDMTLELIGYQGRLRKVEVRRDYWASPPDVTCREGEIRQVLLILITNALDAMQDEGILTIGTGVEGSAVTVDIGDDGPGIPAELLQHIFDPFFTTKTEQRGTGLGLSIAQRIVAGHNGSLRVLAHGADGTTFRFTLPR